MFSERDYVINNFKFRFKLLHKLGFLSKLAKFINNFFYGIGLGAYFNRYDSSFIIYSSNEDKKLYYKIEKKLFVNFGSGSFSHKFWKNFDYPGTSEYYKRIQGIQYKDFTPIDLCAENLILPFKNNSVKLIYCSHTLEHLEKKKAIRFLKECARVIENNGVMRIVLPDIKKIADNLKIAVKQDSSLIKKAKNLAYYICTPSKKLKSTLITNLVIKSKYNPNKISKEISKKIQIKFNQNNPEYHLSYWDNLIIFKNSKKIGFKKYMPTIGGASLAKPFLNQCVFDNTERNLSFYCELIGKHTN